MPQGGAVSAPPGFVDLCRRDSAACGPARNLETAALASSTVLATSSLGGWRGDVPHGAETTAQTDADEPALVAFNELSAYRPAIDADFVAAGEMRPTTASPTAAVVAETISPRLVAKDKLRLINLINREVNKEVQRADDFDLYGLLEYWSLPRVIDGKMYGDCEDYALEKRRRLIAAGVPAQSLSMAVAVTARGESHAVLVVSMEMGDMILDNLTPWATPWQDLNYRWVERQTAGGADWVSIS
ncbi:MAG: transglutaminase-like cysteine peptidase [Caulobacter sp.]|nr:transglutaminase-like cysteine peptidase [Caulobacter sp.]